MLNIMYRLLTSAALLYATASLTADDQELDAIESYNLTNIKKPAVFIIKSNSNILFEVGKMYQFVSFITGDFPLQVEWKFEHCHNYPACLDSSIQTLRSSTHRDTLKTLYRFSTSIELIIDGTGTLICNVTNKFGSSVEMYTIIVADVEIRPDVTELTLKTGDDRILICKGSVPVQWFFNPYNQITPILNTSSTQMFSKNHHHLSRLSLNKVSYLDIGYYYCGPFVTDLRLVQQNFKKMYIFVRDETHLIAIPDDFNAWYLIYNIVNDIDLFVIPCRPTSPEVNVTLFVNDIMYEFPENEQQWYNNNNNNQGYAIPSSLLDDSNVYLCHADRNNITESQTLTVPVNPKRPRIGINGGNLNHIVVGQNISLNCSVNIKSYQTYWYPFELQWIVDTEKLQADHVQVDKKRYYQKAGSILFYIENVTREDEGEYLCEQTFIPNGKKYRATYTLKTFLPNETYLHLSILNNEFQAINLTQYETVQWKIRVSAYPSAILEWRDPNNEKIGMNSEKAFVKNYDTLSKLMIKNIQISDSGIYRLFAENGVHRKNISVTLLVKDVSNGLYIKGPSIVVAGDNVTIKCYASKNIYQNYIKWIHQSTNNEDVPISTNENITIIKNETQLLYHSCLTVENISNKFDGIIKCTGIKQSPNENLSETAEFPIKIEDPSEPVVYNSSGFINLNMSDKSIQLCCYAGGMPPPIIQWFKNGQPLLFDENNFRTLIGDKNQKLTIYFPEYEDKGEYICNASNKINYAISTITLNFTNESNENFITISLFGSFILICVVWVICITKNRKSTLCRMLHFKNSAIDKWNSDLGIQEQAYLLPYDKRWEFSRNKLKLGKRLGSGAFGAIVKAEATGIIDKGVNTAVVVKIMRPNVHPRYTRAFDSELKIMIHIGRHLNLVNLLGACTKNKSKGMMMIVEYCCFGNIQRYLLKQRENFINQVTLDGGLDYDVRIKPKNISSGNKVDKTTIELYNDSGTQITSDCSMIPNEDKCSNNNNGNACMAIKPLCTHDLICWSYQVARGMEYLASKKILNGNLSTRNILLAENNIVKICDLGIAKTLNNCKYYKEKSIQDLLPVKWMALESLRDRVFSTQSEVWAFGIVMWEMFSLSVSPYPNIFTYEDLFNKLIDGYRMEIPKYANSKIYNIMLDCWNEDPMKRPSFIELSELLGDLLQRQTKIFYDTLNETFMKMDTGRPSSILPSNLSSTAESKNNTNSILNI